VRKDILLGQQQITCEARRGSSISSNAYSYIWLSVILVEMAIAFTNADGHGSQSTTSSALLTITIASPSLAAIDTPNPATTILDDSAGAVRPTIQPNDETRQPTAVTAPLSPSSQTHALQTEGDTSVGSVSGSQAGMSCTLSHAGEVVEAMDTMEAWRSAIDIVKQVMDTIGPIAAV
jgi:hypothetical protein